MELDEQAVEATLNEGRSVNGRSSGREKKTESTSASGRRRLIYF